MKINFNEKYKELQELIEEYLLQIIPNEEPKYIYEPFKYIMQGGGKRIRPIIALLSAGICGAKHTKALEVAAAIEILHNFTLVHDDIMDGSDFRRGRENIHKKWDSATAILTGDYMVAFAYKLLPKINPRAIQIIDVFTKAFVEVNLGQGFDMTFNTKKDATYDEYVEMITKKTATLIFASALMGGHIAEATEKQLEALVTYGYNIGLAFQIQDDYLDMTADEAVLGKKTGLDIIEGKKTCLIIKANNCNLEKEDRQLMDKFYNENGLKEELIPKMDALFTKYNIYNVINDLADKYFAQAKLALEDMPNNEYKEMMLQLVDMLNKRDK